MVDAVDTIKLLGSLLGNKSLSRGSGNNVLGSILGAVMGGTNNQQTQGGADLGQLLGGLLGGQQQQSSGGLEGLLGGLLGGGQGNSTGMGGGGGLGGLLGAAVAKYAQAKSPELPNPQTHQCDHLPQGVDQRQAADHAALAIRAMINAAKSDGQLDQTEQNKIVSKLGDISQAEAEFLRNEFAQPLDVNGFARSIPNGMQQQIYALSLSAIDLDTNQEAQYLHQLAQAMGIQPDLANQIHTQLGAPVLYS